MSATTVTGLYLPADPTAAAEVVQVIPTLDGARRYVGASDGRAYLEDVSLWADGTHLLVDEDGHAKGLPYNHAAAGVLSRTIVGDVLVLGATPRGEWASLSVQALDALARMLGVVLA